MPEFIFEGYTAMAWVPTIASIATPTVAELTAGTRLDPFMTKDGWSMSWTENMVDNSHLNETYDAELHGSYKADMELKFVREFTTDTAWTLVAFGTNGYLVARFGVPVATAFAATQKVQVYPAQMGNPLPGGTATNQRVGFTSKLAVTAQPNLKAVVAA